MRRLSRFSNGPASTAQTSRTITNVDELLEQLALIRDSGFAVDDGEQEVGVRCVAVLVPHPTLMASLSFRAPRAGSPPTPLPTSPECSATRPLRSPPICSDLGRTAGAPRSRTAGMSFEYRSGPYAPRRGARRSRRESRSGAEGASQLATGALMNVERIYNFRTARDAARRRMPKALFDFIDGGADDEVTLRENHAAYGDITFRPRHAISIPEPDLTTSVLGAALSMPVALAPCGGSLLVWPDGERTLARAAKAEGTVATMSTASGTTLEEVAAAVAGGPVWFQLYYPGNREAAEAIVDAARPRQASRRFSSRSICRCAATRSVCAPRSASFRRVQRFRTRSATHRSCFRARDGHGATSEMACRTACGRRAPPRRSRSRRHRGAIGRT